MLAWVTRFGEFISKAIVGAGFGLALLGRAAAQLPSVFRRQSFHMLVQQMYFSGIQTVPVTMVVSIFTGMILALNSGLSLEQIGQEGLMGRIVVVSITREMGPFMTGLILAASVGSAMAAELGTMKVSEEIDALEVMAIDPARFLVLPRVLAMAIMAPVVTVYVVTVGTLGGAVISAARYGVSFQRFSTDAWDYLAEKDIYSGLLKAFVFGLVISIVGCSQGLRAKGGAIGVGQATRQSVVISYLLIIILGYYITFLFFSVRW